ncbi:hypothetical protein CRI93_11470 [Longimonas halophila]|uniref:Uncharacterized protein n=1 Tax=Longimonas halophila TaxID=1469170 RepID=A0A2H3NJP7_9BACT|nr:hypothetical protein [Longimonas halophila]PEN05722.1 hypothetical protein CRI93_11470 [Longimonas halophila]
MSSPTRPSLSAGADLVLFVLVVLGIGGAFVALYPALTAEPPESWNQQTTEEERADRADPTQKLMSQLKGEVPQVLRGNPLDGIPALHRGQARMSWSSGSAASARRAPSGRTSGAFAGRAWSSSELGDGVTSPGYTASPRASGGARPSQGRRSSGADPGGWAGALASSSGELRALERQVGAIDRQLRVASQSSAAERVPAWANADESITGPAASMTNPPLPNPGDPNPPLPPDPVPVDGGLVLLALAGGTYGWQRLRTGDAPSPQE